jgi:hypothetical protein
MNIIPTGGIVRNSSASPKTTLVTVYDGRTCIGFVLSRGKLGFEAFDNHQHSQGLFGTQQEAAAALSKSNSPTGAGTSR